MEIIPAPPEFIPAILKIILATLEICLVTLEICLAILEICLAILEICLATLEISLATLEIILATLEISLATLGIYLATLEICLALGKLQARVSFAKMVSWAWQPRSFLQGDGLEIVMRRSTLPAGRQIHNLRLPRIIPTDAQPQTPSKQHVRAGGSKIRNEG